jgi:hypothetical protein
MTDQPPAPPIGPVVDWFSRHGVKVFALLVLIELAFHAWAVSSAKRRDAEDASRRTPVVDTLAR